MALGAALWGTSNVASEHGRSVTKTRHIGARYGYENLRWNPGSPMFPQVGGAGLTVKSYQDLICVNQFGKRFWNELDDTYGFLNACLGRHDPRCEEQEVERRWSHLGDLRRRSVRREEWDPKPPNVDPNGFFFSADTHRRARAQDRATPIRSAPMPARTLEETVAQIQLVRRCGQGSGVRQTRPDVQEFRSRRSTRHGRRRFCTTRSPVFASTAAAKCSTSAGR